MKNINITIIVFLLLTIPGHSNAQSFLGDEKEIQVILKNIESFSKAIMSSDHNQIGQFYTADARIFPNNTRIIEGREAIVQYWQQPDGSGISHHKVTPREIKIIGGEAYDYGYYEGVSYDVTGKESSWKGKYVIIWRKQSGDWKIYLDIWNRVRE
jgi:ketosteroid isomerase-like protein